MRPSRAPDGDKIVRLRPPRGSPADERTARMAARVRTHLSLMQGYAEIMEDVSPQLKSQILRVMAQKSRRLVLALHPFLEQEKGRRPPIRDYRNTRQRTRELLTDYRAALQRLQETVNDAYQQASNVPRMKR